MGPVEEIILDRMQKPLCRGLSCLVGCGFIPAPFLLGSALGWGLSFQKSISIDGRGWTGGWGWFGHCVAPSIPGKITGNTRPTVKRCPSHNFLIRAREYANNLLRLL